MHIELAGLIVLLAGGVFALIFGRRPRLSTALGVGSALVGCGLGIVPAVQVLAGRPEQTLRLAWSVPYGSFFVQIDPLTGFFLVVIFGLSAVAAVFGGSYLKPFAKTKNLGASWFFYNLLVAGMALVVLARNGVLFLMAWEAMSLASFFLVTFEDEQKSVRRAGWIYLIAAHLGTAFLIAFFILLAGGTGTMDFGSVTGLSSRTVDVLFILAIVGFGTKAGFWPLHVWLPEAHPAAPSHVSALMSGVMIKTGIYGLVRTLTLLGEPHGWWGWVLIGIGISSGVLGVLFALAQHDLKRLLAYHSVENIGIIALGLGVGVVGVVVKSPSLTLLGFAGGLFHVLNHAVFKGLLFLGAGSVVHATQTRDLDHLGGLMKRMPWTAVIFLIGSIAICGLPPLNGFASEFLIYSGILTVGPISGLRSILLPLATIGGLALIGGLAAACFTKAFGIVFLGEPRSAHAEHAHEAEWPMKLAMIILALACIGLGALAPAVLSAGELVLRQVTGLQSSTVTEAMGPALGVMGRIVQVSGIFAGLVILIVLIRKGLLSGRTVEEHVTWDCGYARPTARMQYTSSSFAQFLVFLFRMFLRSKNYKNPPEGLFPSAGSFHTETPDAGRTYLFGPVFDFIERVTLRLRWLQQGRVQLYVLYIALTLWILLVWKLR